MSEVTHDMILDKYDVQLKKEMTTGWVKDITLTDAVGNVTEIRLYWDMDRGYWVVTNGLTKLPEMDMPEFEYVLDGITEDMKYDRDNPWNYADFGSKI